MYSFIFSLHAHGIRKGKASNKGISSSQLTMEATGTYKPWSFSRAHAPQVLSTKGTKEMGYFPTCSHQPNNRAVIEDRHYGAALPAWSIHWQSELLVSRKALRQVMQMLVGREQAEVPFTLRLPEVLDKTVPRVADRETLWITCWQWQRLDQPLLLNNCVELLFQHHRLDFNRAQNKIIHVKKWRPGFMCYSSQCQ